MNKHDSLVDRIGLLVIYAAEDRIDLEGLDFRSNF